MHIRKDDTVVVITGEDKGQKGKVIKAIPKENKVVVEGVNVQTKHAKADEKQLLLKSSIRKDRSMYPTSCSMTARPKRLPESVIVIEDGKKQSLKKTGEKLD